MNILRPGFYSASVEIVNVTCKSFKQLLKSFSD